MSDSKEIPSWGGDEETWNDYLDQVQWFFWSTKPLERRLIASRLARKLTGSARTALKGHKPRECDGIQGIAKLLRVLQARIGDLPVPDLASKLDSYFFKLRSHVGESMHAWGIRSIETYRLLLQALDRVKGITPD